MKNALFSSFFALGTVGGWRLTQSTGSGDVNEGLVQYKYAILPYRKFHCGDETILRPSYFHNGIAYTGKMTFLYWIRALKSLGANDQYRAWKSVAQNHEHIFFGAIWASWCYRQSTAKCQWFNFLYNMNLILMATFEPPMIVVKCDILKAASKLGQLTKKSPSRERGNSSPLKSIYIFLFIWYRRLAIHLFNSYINCPCGGV